MKPRITLLAKRVLWGLGRFPCAGLCLQHVLNPYLLSSHLLSFKDGNINGYFSCCCSKMPSQSSLKKEGLILALDVKIQLIIWASPGSSAWGSWPHGNHNLKRHREEHLCSAWLSQPCPFYFHSRLHVMGLPTVRLGIPILINLICKFTQNNPSGLFP